jgi:hypothetical protein
MGTLSGIPVEEYLSVTSPMWNIFRQLDEPAE